MASFFTSNGGFTKIWVCFFVVVGCLPFTECNAQPLPRLLLIEDKGKIGFLLPESHFGIPIEFDNYYDEIIIPAARASNMAIYEARGLGGSMFDQDSRSDCANLDEARARRKESTVLIDELLYDNPGKMIIRGFAEAFKGEDDKSYRGLIEGHPFFLKLDEIKAQLAEPENMQTKSAKNRPGVAALLAKLIAKGDVKREKSIEDNGDLKKSFCLLPENRQHDVVKALVGLFKTKEDFDVVKLDMPKARSCFISLVLRANKQLACRQNNDHSSNAVEPGCGQLVSYPTAECNLYKRLDPAYYEWMLPARSKVFIPHMESALQTSIPFFIVGGAHIPDTALGPGLITLLTERGYKISLIENRAQLDDILKKIRSMPKN